MSDRIELSTPVGRAWDPVIRLDLGFDELDDLQLAVERLLAEARFEDRVTLSFEILERSVRVRIGPILTGAVAEALQSPDGPPGELTLGRILQTVVDSYGVEKVEDGHMVVRLEKAVRRG